MAGGMFTCDSCHRATKPGTPAHRVVVEARPTTYPHRSKSQSPGRRKDRFNRKRWRDDPGGSGYEIQTEAVMCPACARDVGATIDPWGALTPPELAPAEAPADAEQA